MGHNVLFAWLVSKTANDIRAIGYRTAACLSVPGPRARSKNKSSSVQSKPSRNVSGASASLVPTILRAFAEKKRKIFKCSPGCSFTTSRLSLVTVHSLVTPPVRTKSTAVLRRDQTRTQLGPWSKTSPGPAGCQFHSLARAHLGLRVPLACTSGRCPLDACDDVCISGSVWPN